MESNSVSPCRYHASRSIASLQSSCLASSVTNLDTNGCRDFDATISKCIHQVHVTHTSLQILEQIFAFQWFHICALAMSTTETACNLWKRYLNFPTNGIILHLTKFVMKRAHNPLTPDVRHHEQKRRRPWSWWLAKLKSISVHHVYHNFTNYYYFCSHGFRCSAANRLRYMN